MGQWFQRLEGTGDRPYVGPERLEIVGAEVACQRTQILFESDGIGYRGRVSLIALMGHQTDLAMSRMSSASERDDKF